MKVRVITEEQRKAWKKQDEKQDEENPIIVPTLIKDEAIDVIVRYKKGWTLGENFYGKYKCSVSGCNCLFHNIKDWAEHIRSGTHGRSSDAISEMESVARGYYRSGERTKTRIYRESLDGQTES